MWGKKVDPSVSGGIKRSLNRKILRSTTLNILILVVVCCAIMALSMQSLANSILLDSLQPMARQSAKTVEANIHMLADRMMTIAGDPRMDTVYVEGPARAPEVPNAPETPDGEEPGTETPAETPEEPEEERDTRVTDTEATEANRGEVLEEAAEIYELYTIALYGLDGQLIQGIDGAPESLESEFLSLLQETDNLTTRSSTIFQGKLGIMMGMPVKEEGATAFYVMGVYKYDTLNDVISSINLGRTGTAYMVSEDGTVTGHPDQSLALNRSSLSQLSDGNSEAVERVTTGETGATEFPINGKRMLVAFSPIRGTQWSLVIQIPKADYNHFINAAMLVAVLATMAVLVISMLLVPNWCTSAS